MIPRHWIAFRRSWLNCRNNYDDGWFSFLPILWQRGGNAPPPLPLNDTLHKYSYIPGIRTVANGSS